jgi:hypothetical protein
MFLSCLVGTPVDTERTGQWYEGGHPLQTAAQGTPPPTRTERPIYSLDRAQLTHVTVVYSLSSTLHITGYTYRAPKRALAIVAEEGQATLDGGGRVRLIQDAGADPNALWWRASVTGDARRSRSGLGP